MAGKRKVHTPEFKLRAVQMITEQKLSVADWCYRAASCRWRTEVYPNRARSGGTRVERDRGLFTLYLG